MAEIKKRRLDDDEESQDAVDAALQRKHSKIQFMTSTMDEQALRNLLIRITSEVPAANEMLEEQVQDDPVLRKIFVRGFGSETAKETIIDTFSVFGDVEDVTIISDRTTGRPKGYGFVTFRDMEGAFKSLQDQNMEIDGRRIFYNLAAIKDGKSGNQPVGNVARATGGGGGGGDNEDIDSRKLFVRGLGYDVTPERLRSLFEEYGEVEDCTVITDKATGQSKGYGFITFKTTAAANAAVDDGKKEVDGRMVHVHFASSRSKDQDQQQQQQGAGYNMQMGGMRMHPMAYPGYNPAQMAQYYQMAGMPYRMW